MYRPNMTTESFHHLNSLWAKMETKEQYDEIMKHLEKYEELESS